MGTSLKRNTVSGIAWTSIEQFSLQISSFIFGIFLARLLSPSDYGIIGMVAIFLAISDTLIFGGFTQALIQKSSKNPLDFSTTLIYSVLFSVILYVILFFCAPSIAIFYEMPIIKNVLRVIALSLIFNSFYGVQNARYQIKLNFKIPSIISVIVGITRGILGVVLAFNNYGVWALVYSQVFASILRTILIWSITSWKYKLGFSNKSFKSLFAFGSRLMLIALMDQFFKNIYPLIIGKVYNATSLGFYSKARSYSSLPAEPSTKTISKVTYPILCKIKNDTSALTNSYSKLLKTSAFIIFPLMLLLILLAKPLVVVLITEKWLPIVPLLKVLCLAQIFYPILALNSDIFQVTNKTSLLFKLEFTKKIISVVIIVVSCFGSLLLICWGQVLISLISFFINTFFMGKIINFGVIAHFKDLRQVILNCLLSYIVCSVCLLYINNNILQISIIPVIWCIVYYSLGRIFNKTEINLITYSIKTIVLKKHKL